MSCLEVFCNLLPNVLVMERRVSLEISANPSHFSCQKKEESFRLWMEHLQEIKWFSISAGNSSVPCWLPLSTCLLIDYSRLILQAQFLPVRMGFYWIVGIYHGVIAIIIHCCVSLNLFRNLTSHKDLYWHFQYRVFHILESLLRLLLSDNIAFLISICLVYICVFTYFWPQASKGCNQAS